MVFIYIRTLFFMLYIFMFQPVTFQTLDNLTNLKTRCSLINKFCNSPWKGSFITYNLSLWYKMYTLLSEVISGLYYTSKKQRHGQSWKCLSAKTSSILTIPSSYTRFLNSNNRLHSLSKTKEVHNYKTRTKILDNKTQTNK